MLKIINSFTKINYLRCNISKFNALRDEEKKKSKKKVSETVELVTLVDTNDKILGLKPKPETEKLARKLNLLLERVDDPKYGKIYPAYKLVSSADLLKAESKTSTSRALKKLPINCRISDHDLTTKLQIIQKWIAKNCEVHVAVMGSQDKSELKKTIFEKMQEQLKDQGRIIDIRKKDDAIKFIILPPKVFPAKQTERNKDASQTE
ncbi:uncharacterized protein TNIN_460341 [Trichonephila inaurata madagascariensis]|uniref:Translation initiation factor IF-3 n=1 Tax=Trichonephila inaurata madagascariensis TaxID=2747483 RepID=A0A8X7CK87_9ARAC|nr:uncharacterized protein TNIN_460341 [Trichonephila inaurata madagascariensis]